MDNLHVSVLVSSGEKRRHRAFRIPKKRGTGLSASQKGGAQAFSIPKRRGIGLSASQKGVAQGFQHPQTDPGVLPCPGLSQGSPVAALTTDPQGVTGTSQEPPPHTAHGVTAFTGSSFPACVPTAAPASLLAQNYSKRIHLTPHPLPLPPPSIVHPKDHSEPGLS